MVEFLGKNVETLAILVIVCVTLCDLQKLKNYVTHSISDVNFLLLK